MWSESKINNWLGTRCSIESNAYMKTKKQTWIWVICILAVLIIVGAALLWQFNTVHLGAVQSAEARFIHRDVNSVNRLKKEDIEVLKFIFNGKVMYIDNPSCGFSENTSIKFDDKLTFCIACDTCPTVYIKEKNRYIELSEKQQELLYALLEPYGFYFPCV